MENNTIVFFDGICNFCNSSVNFIIKRDKKNYFKFASLQSEYAKKFFDSSRRVSCFHLVPKVYLVKRKKSAQKVSRSLETRETEKKLDSFTSFPTSALGTEKIFDSIILFDNNKLYIKSSAALHIAKHLKGLWKILFIFIIIPPFIRNLFYDIIAKNRYKWFGKREECMIPNEKYKKQFLV